VQISLATATSTPTTQCTPIDFKNCCPLVYDTATTLSGITVVGASGSITAGVTTLAATSSGTQTVWGNNTDGYAWGSHLGRALCHSGLVPNGASGQVRIKSLGPKNSFGSSPANGVTSASFNSDYRCAFVFELITSGTTSTTTVGTTTTTTRATTTTTRPTVPKPRIDTFTIGTDGIPRWTISGGDLLKLTLTVIQGKTTSIMTSVPYVIKEWNTDNRGKNSQLEYSLKTLAKTTLVQGSQYYFRLCAEGPGGSECTAQPGLTRPDGTKITWDVMYVPW